MENKNEFLTKDIYEAAALYAYGQKLLGLQRERTFFWFVFEGKVESEKLSQQYWQSENPIPPKSYADAIKTLKDRLFAQK